MGLNPLNDAICAGELLCSENYNLFVPSLVFSWVLFLLGSKLVTVGKDAKETMVKTLKKKKKTTFLLHFLFSFCCMRDEFEMSEYNCDQKYYGLAEMKIDETTHTDESPHTSMVER